MFNNEEIVKIYIHTYTKTQSYRHGYIRKYIYLSVY